MEIIIYFIVSAAMAGAVMFSKKKKVAIIFASVFYGLQALFAVFVAWKMSDGTSAQFFTFDTAGMLMFSMMAIVSPLIFYNGLRYLDRENLNQFKLFQALMIGLCIMISAVYFSNNLAVTWIFLEATTLCSAGLIYHRQDRKSLEATWKYIFVCSTGIAIAYLGILLLSSIATTGDLSYTALEQLIGNGDSLYLKIAFLFILVGYSCKMEIFPLYTIGVDANAIAPTPASALISSALVNAGFLSIFRVYKLMAHSPIFDWVGNVLLITGVFTMLIGALYLRRTNHYKRFLSYSTVENMGIVLIGLGIGGIGVFAALLHLTMHTFIKSGLFLQLGQIGKSYGNYRINRIGDYVRVNRLGATVILLAMIVILAFPPSPLFVSEMMIFREIISEGKWWLLIIMVLLICVVIYSFGYRFLQLCYKSMPNRPEPEKYRIESWTLLGLFLAVAAVGVFQPDFLVTILREIANLGV